MYMFYHLWRPPFQVALSRVSQKRLLILFLECQSFSPRCFLPMRIVKGTAPEAHPEIPQLWNMRGNSRIQLKNGRLIDMITGNSPLLHQPSFPILFLCRMAAVVWPSSISHGRVGPFTKSDAEADSATCMRSTVASSLAWTVLSWRSAMLRRVKLVCSWVSQAGTLGTALNYWSMPWMSCHVKLWPCVNAGFHFGAITESNLFRSPDVHASTFSDWTASTGVALRKQPCEVGRKKCNPT